MVRRSARRSFPERPFPFGRRDSYDRVVGRIKRPSGKFERCPATARVDERLEYSGAGHRDPDAETCGDSRAGRRRVHLRDRAHGIHRRKMGGHVRNPADQPRECSSRRRLHSSAGFELAPARAGRRAVHRIGHDGRTGSPRYAHDESGHSSRICAGKLTGQLARRHGEVHSRRFGSGIPDALHNARPCNHGPDQDRTGFCGAVLRRSAF